MSSAILDHIEQIQAKVELMHLSARSHALLVNGPAGFGKTQAVTEALEKAGLAHSRLGSYSTPLHLFNFLHENQGIVVLDDVAGLFYDRAAMAILKAATWSAPNGRMIGWGSATTKANVESFEWRGKAIVISNSFPTSADAAAVRSRSLHHNFQISVTTAKQLLRAAAADSKWFVNTEVSQAVAAFLCENLTESNLSEISYRTLHIGYDAAESRPKQWRELLGSMIQIEKPKRDAMEAANELSRSGMSVEDQAEAFQEMTGLKRRSFFIYRGRLGLKK